MSQRKLNKFYIKPLDITNMSFQEFEVTMQDILKDDKLVGYFYDGKKPEKTLNLYLIKRKYYDGPEICISDYTWKLFLSKTPESNNYLLFENPPIELWLDTKNNWCKKIASILSKKFDMKYDEALSHLYMAVVKCYARGLAYMGNLSYVYKAAYHEILMYKRFCKKRFITENNTGNTISMNTVIDTSSDGEDITLEDALPAPEDVSETSLGYRELLQNCKDLLSDSFSPREIEQIILLEGSETSLPINLYARLARWRNKHSVKEVINYD